MNITVFGATGVIGQLVVRELLDRGHHITAYLRNPAKIPPEWGERVAVIIGAITDADLVNKAVEGADAVVSALGPSLDRSARGLPLVKGTALIVRLVSRHGVTRYVGHGTPSIHDIRDHVGLRVRAIGLIARTIFPRAYKEMLGMGRIVTGSDLDWTIVRFSAPTNGPRTGRVRAGYFGRDRIGLRVTRADIAAFTAAQVSDGSYSRSAPAISN
jgi:putative NADH-flavin reductase